MSNLNEQIYVNNNNLLLEIINKLENIMKDTNDKLIIQRIKDIIIIMNKVINNCNQIRKDIQNLSNNMNQRFNNLELNIKSNNFNSNIQIKTYDNGKYEGQIINNKREGKGIFYYNDGTKYEGDWKNDFIEGKGIVFLNNGDRYEDVWKNGKREGK